MEPCVTQRRLVDIKDRHVSFLRLPGKAPLALYKQVLQRWFRRQSLPPGRLVFHPTPRESIFLPACLGGVRHPLERLHGRPELHMVAVQHNPSRAYELS